MRATRHFAAIFYHIIGKKKRMSTALYYYFISLLSVLCIRGTARPPPDEAGYELLAAWATPVMKRTIDAAKAGQINRELLPMVTYHYRRWNATRSPEHHKAGDADSDNDGFYRYQMGKGPLRGNWKLLSASMAGQALLEEIRAALRRYPHHKEVLNPYEKKRDGIIEMWATFAQGQSMGHRVHDHGNANAVAGVYYVSTPNGSAPIRLYDPRHLPTKFYDLDLAPTRGTLLLFPSWLRHSVPASFIPSGEARIAVAFNVGGSCLRSANLHTILS